MHDIPTYDYLDSIIVIEPGIREVVNITPHIGLGLGLYYRFVNGVDSGAFSDPSMSGPSGLSNTKLSGPSLEFSLRFS